MLCQLLPPILPHLHHHISTPHRTVPLMKDVLREAVNKIRFIPVADHKVQVIVVYDVTCMQALRARVHT